MDSLRLVLWGGFFVLLWLGVNQWSLDYMAPPTNPSMASAQTEGPTTLNNKGAEEPSGVLGLSDNLPTVTIEGLSLIHISEPTRRYAIWEGLVRV